MRSDEELMVAVRDGDLDAFEILVDRHRDTAVNVAYRILGETALAEEMAQEAFLKIFEASDQYRASASFTTYLYRVVTNLCYDHLEKLGPDSVDPTEGPSEADHRSTPEQDLLEDEQQRAIQSALDGLPSRQRIAITLQHYEELSYAGIAEVMDCSEKAVERLVARARDQLHDLLSEESCLDVSSL